MDAASRDCSFDQSDVDPETLSLAKYQSLAAATDSTKETHTGVQLLLLGLFGEVGSLMSELKKKQRDAESYAGYEKSVVEELGDVLWYFSNIASRSGLSLVEIAPSSECKEIDSDCKFRDLQPSLAKTSPKTPEHYGDALMKLAGNVGALSKAFAAASPDNFSADLRASLPNIFCSLVEVANDSDVRIADAAFCNIGKIFDRWPSKKVYPRLFDERYESDEQLPRIFEMVIYERVVGDKSYVFQKCNGIFVGDRLTDNKLEQDDYRFHDVFHLAYVAKLGWSPVIRRLLKLKRKSNPLVDENEDGARAALVEEGISTWVFNHAETLNFYSGLQVVDYNMLKSVKELASGYEVESCPLWLWEEAILSGFEMFRNLKRHRKGIISVDMNERTITFDPMSDGL
ncbi:MAG: nucleoside triphosphate pyrophosphohydrolase family protein [Sedimenticola sp.]